MAKEAFMCFFFLSFLIVCCSGALVGSSYRERVDTESPTTAGPTFLHKNKIYQSRTRLFVTDHKILSTLTNYDIPVDFFLNRSLIEDFVTKKSSGVSWLKAHVVSFLPQVDIRSIIVSCGSECLGQNEIPLLLSTLRSFHSVLSNLKINRELKVSVAFSLSFLEKLNASHKNDLLRILRFIEKTDSFIMIEDSIDGELSMGDHFVQHVIERVSLAAPILPCKDVPMVLTIKSRVIPSPKKLALFNEGVSQYFEASSQITKRIVALYAEVHTTDDEDVAQKKHEMEEEEIFPLSQREAKNKVHIRRTLDETNNSPTPVLPTNPTSTTPVITPPATPAIITVPSTSPVTVSPTTPTTVPITVPSSTPVISPPTNPANSPVPVTSPPTTPITNPAASYPPPSAGSVPVTNPLSPPASTNGPATQGQSWCAAKSGVSETALQSALDYACGLRTVDCSQIQQGGSCYNPNSIQNHASFAFNSYYQKNPAPTSCDFGGTATIVTTNPSTGSCIYPSSSSAASTSGTGAPSSDFGSQSPPDVNSSHSAGLRPLLGCMVLVISLVTGSLSMNQ